MNIKTTKEIVRHLKRLQNNKVKYNLDAELGLYKEMEWLSADFVRKKIEDFQQTIIDALGWNNGENDENRDKLGIKFDILLSDLGFLEEDKEQTSKVLSDDEAFKSVQGQNYKDLDQSGLSSSSPKYQYLPISTESVNKNGGERK